MSMQRVEVDAVGGDGKTKYVARIKGDATTGEGDSVIDALRALAVALFDERPKPDVQADAPAQETEVPGPAEPAEA